MTSYFFFQAEDGIRDIGVTGVQTCALPISRPPAATPSRSTSRRRTGSWPRRTPAWGSRAASRRSWTSLPGGAPQVRASTRTLPPSQVRADMGGPGTARATVGGGTYGGEQARGDFRQSPGSSFQYRVGGLCLSRDHHRAAQG